MDLRFEFDTGPGGQGAFFAVPRSVIRADHPHEVAAAFDAIAQARAEGRWLAGVMSYELGYLFSHRLADLMPQERRVPLMLFGVYDAPVAPRAPTAPADQALDLTPAGA